MSYIKVKNKTILAVVGIALLSVGCNKNPVAVINTPPPEPLKQIEPTPAPLPEVEASGKPTQFVVLAFDGSYSLVMWKNTLDFAEQMKLEGKPANFTYFISGVYFLNYRKASRYLPPKKPPGTSQIGFANNNTEVENRVAYVNRAISEGHEIGSHLNGHFNGSGWTVADWQQEFSEFDKLVFSIDKNNDVDAKDADRYELNLLRTDLVGFRAPELGKNNAMYTALVDNHYAYDTSGVGKPEEWPKKLPSGVWEFPLAQIKYADTNSKILSMDYNFYFKQSQAKDVTKKGEQLWQDYFDKTYTSYINYFNNNYQGTRAPVFIGSHFSEWNDGVYWEVMKKFAIEVCGQSEVRCVTHKELMGHMNSRPTLGNSSK